jgi:hypothetical protein
MPFFLTLLLFAVSDAIAQAGDPSCVAAVNAIHRIYEQPRIRVQGHVAQGSHPDGYASMELFIFDGKRYLRVLDAARFSGALRPGDQDLMQSVLGINELLPDSDCLNESPSAADPNDELSYSYRVKVARAEAQLKIWISKDLGLLRRIQINGPQLSYARALSRPGKAPQVFLRANGLRYMETLEFTYGKDPVSAAARRLR